MAQHLGPKFIKVLIGSWNFSVKLSAEESQRAKEKLLQAQMTFAHVFDIRFPFTLYTLKFEVYKYINTLLES